uniref:Uncharacterized protein n=1 Tax=Eutreptiella gymnastica TaxID=73025 RepID=A0A7S4CJ02_9EUGL
MVIAPPGDWGKGEKINAIRSGTTQRTLPCLVPVGFPKAVTVYTRGLTALTARGCPLPFHCHLENPCSRAKSAGGEERVPTLSSPSTPLANTQPSAFEASLDP